MNCKHCGLFTSNKSFCNHSCSASFINSHSPKRKALLLTCRKCNRQYKKSHGTWIHCLDCKFVAEKNIPLGVLKSRGCIKGRLIRSQGHQCEICKRKTWLKKAIPLSLDHVDGNKFNVAADNLRLLCANCHAQTETFAGKNIGRYSRLAQSEAQQILTLKAPGSRPGTGTK